MATWWRRRRRRRESAISCTRSKTGHPDTCCRSIRLMIPYAKLATWQKVGQSARCGLWSGLGAIGSGTGWAKGGQTVGVLSPLHWIPTRFYVFAKISKGTGKKEGSDDYVRLFNTKGSKTNTEIRRALARPVIDNVPDRVLPFVMRQPFSKLR